MDRGLIQLTNYQDHPENNRYTVFHYTNEQEATHFSRLLDEASIKYETDKEPGKNRNGEMVTYYLFAVHKRNFKQANKLNFITKGKFRKPSIENRLLRWLLVIVVFGLIAIAIWRASVAG